jgi:hypothetical protein
MGTHMDMDRAHMDMAHMDMDRDMDIFGRQIFNIKYRTTTIQG